MSCSFHYIYAFKHYYEKHMQQAIDIVLLPPKEITEKFIGLNNSLII